MKSFYIVKPHFIGFDKNQLHYIDVLTYITIRSYYNYKDKICYPSYETIAEKMGASKSLVIESTDRLIKSGYLYKKRRFNNSNIYSFKGTNLVDKIPIDVLALDLSIYEKAMLILLRQCCVGTRTDIWGSIKQVSDKLGLSYKTVYTQTKSLIEKGYVEELPIGKKARTRNYRLTPLIDWTYSTDAVNSVQQQRDVVFFPVGDRLMIV